MENCDYSPLLLISIPQFPFSITWVLLRDFHTPRLGGAKADPFFIFNFQFLILFTALFLLTSRYENHFWDPFVHDGHFRFTG